MALPLSTHLHIRTAKLHPDYIKVELLLQERLGGAVHSESTAKWSQALGEYRGSFHDLVQPSGSVSNSRREKYGSVELARCIDYEI